MKNLSLTTKMILYFLVVVLISTIGSVVVVFKIQQSVNTSELLESYRLPRFQAADKIVSNALLQVANCRGYLLYGDPSVAADFKKQADENKQLETDLINNASDSKGKQILQELKTANDSYSEAVLTQLFPLKQAGKDQEATAKATEVVPTAKVFIAKAYEYQTFNFSQTQQDIHASVVAAQAAKAGAVVSTILAAIIGILLGGFAARRMIKPIKEMVQIVQNLANGDFRDTKHSAVSNDEIGQLGTAVLKMRKSLRELMQHVNDATGQLASSSEELTANMEQSSTSIDQVTTAVAGLAGGAKKQSSAIDHTTSVVESISANIEEIAATANEVANQSIQAAAKANAGNQSVEKAVGQMVQIEAAVTNSAKLVTTLGDRSNEIGQIVDTIAGIAGQTNLLALNAAIEAARAGEQGRGFAVVAEEVRKLAEQSQEAAQQIADLIGTIQQETNQAVLSMQDGTKEVKLGTEVVNTAGQDFREITGLVTQVSSQVKEISIAIEHMAEGSQQIVTSVEQIDQLSKTATGHSQKVSSATQEQAAVMQEITSASQSLAELGQKLQNSVEKFQL